MVQIKDSYLVALGGLLHDIGKFRQRSGLGGLEAFDLDFADENNTYLHAAHTSKAIDEMGLSSIQNLTQIAASHHKQDISGYEEIVKQADIYSSSERKEGEGGDYIKSKLISIFSEVALENTPNKRYFCVQKLDENIEIPDSQREYSSQDEAKRLYSELYKEFIDDVRQLNLNFQENPFQDFLNLKSVLEKYTSFIPSSSYKVYPDVSLFDHLTTTAAIATALLKDKGKFYLIQGDFTSIQNFIFSKGGKSNKYLAKILRAKSLFVSLAVDFIAFKICKKLDITPLSIIMNAGGKFTILAPKVENIQDILNDIKNEVNKTFAEINYLQTKFVIDYIEESYCNLAYGKASSVFKKMAMKFEEAKLKVDTNIDVFENYIDSFSDNYKRCDICGIVPAPISNQDELAICKYCKKFKEWGEKISRSRYIAFDFTKDIFNGIDIVDSMQNKTQKIYLSIKEDQNMAIKRVANYLPTFESSDINNPKYNLIEDFKPEEAVGVKSFEHIAVDGLTDKEDGYYGRKYLAILKADVDNLGQIFINGFKRKITKEKMELPIKSNNPYKEVKDYSTISRIVSLSRLMDFYFTTLLKKLIKEEYENIYTVFAGGDDLFLIGHYKDILNVQKDIIKTFKKYTQNEDLHLSFGITFTTYTTPLVYMAYKAEEDLEKAKVGDKNKSTILDIVIENSELENLLGSKLQQLQQLISEGFSSSMMYKLFNFIEMAERLRPKELTNEVILQNARWKALLRYFIFKNLSEQLEEERINEISESIIKDIEELGIKFIIPLSLVLYEQRKYS